MAFIWVLSDIPLIISFLFSVAPCSGRGKGALLPLLNVDALNEQPDGQQRFYPACVGNKVHREVGEEKAGKSLCQIAEAGDHQQDTDDPGQETGPVDQVAHREQPQAPEYIDNVKAKRAQIEKEGHQRVHLIGCEGSLNVSAV